MRKFQVTVSLFDFTNEPINYKVYADANNFYEAVEQATLSLVQAYQKNNDSPFGRTTVSINGETVLNN